VRFLDEFVTLIDGLVDKHPGVTKIKTIGDAYFAVAGLTADESSSAQRRDGEVEGLELMSLDHTQSATAANNLVSLVDFCLDVHDVVTQHRFTVRNERLAPDAAASDPRDLEQQRLRRVLGEAFSADGHLAISVRVGVHFGDVVAGIVGSKQPVCVSHAACT
jgi:class 3 adenylate cyclase